MSRELSSYLDFLRFIAALAVLLAHMEQDGLYMAWLPLQRFSHEAVVVFFVLSGFIIYSTTVQSGRSASDYVIARVSRIYSVALPAVILSVGLAFAFAGDFSASERHPSNFSQPSVTASISSLLFLNEAWLNPADLALNHPYWSLCYEVWYYIIFGLWLYCPSRYRWPAVVIAAVLAGPSVMVLFPIWMAGAWLGANKTRLQFKPSQAMAAGAFVASALLIIAINIAGADTAIRDSLKQSVPGFWRLDSSQRFITDYLIGMAIVMNIIVFPHLQPPLLRMFARFKEAFAYLAGFSFTLYLFHRPMTQLLGHYYPNVDKSELYSLLSLASLLLCCLIVSFVTERQVSRWRRWLVRVIARPTAS